MIKIFIKYFNIIWNLIKDLSVNLFKHWVKKLLNIRILNNKCDCWKLPNLNFKI
jgi:hypothetical protein